MQIHRYASPEMRKHWQGWIEPDDGSWITFVAADGSLKCYLDRDPETGAVINLSDLRHTYNTRTVTPKFRED